jgi:hypothetical protein
MERELDHRSGDGIDVTMLWDVDADRARRGRERVHGRVLPDRGGRGRRAGCLPPSVRAYERGCDRRL